MWNTTASGIASRGRSSLALSDLLGQSHVSARCEPSVGIVNAIDGLAWLAIIHVMVGKPFS
jgi:hypothetical protein